MFARIVLAAITVLAVSMAPAAPAKPRPENVTSSTMRGRQNFQQIQNPTALLDQLNGMSFEWPSSYGPRRDIGCFPSADIGTSLPEILDWDVPGEIASGVKLDRLAVLLVEATKQTYAQLEQVYRQVEVLATNVSALIDAVGQHTRLLLAHQQQLADLQTKVAAHETSIADLQKKNTQLEQKNQDQDQKSAELTPAIADLKPPIASLATSGS